MKKIKSTKFIRKIRSVSGESFAEVMIALLIAALGILMLATMISASQKMVLKTGHAEDVRNTSRSILEDCFSNNKIPDDIEEGFSVTADQANLTIGNTKTPVSSKMQGSDAAGINYPVTIYSLESSKKGAENLKVYRYKGNAAEP